MHGMYIKIKKNNYELALPSTSGRYYTVSTEITERTCTAYCQPGEIVCIGYAPV
jgi:hypothetical protein